MQPFRLVPAPAENPLARFGALDRCGDLGDDRAPGRRLLVTEIKLA